MNNMNSLSLQQNYQYLLDEKVKQTKLLFNEFELPALTVYPSPINHYRMRAEFGIWHENKTLYHVMYGQDKKRIRVDTFPAASQLINQAMIKIIPLLKDNDLLRYKLFRIDYLSTLSGQLLISLIYHRKLDDSWLIEAQKLKQALSSVTLNIQLIGRASNQKICLEHDYVDEELTILGHQYTYRQIENSFTQPNAHINIDMLSWAINATRGSKGDLLELYCGNGNFSIALAQNFRRVLATEIAKSSVKAAQYNIEINKIDNVSVVRLSAKELTEAINRTREFNRLQGIDLSDYQCDTVLVDPPRCGLDLDTINMISKYTVIIYISCNPATLKENLLHLTKTHQIKQMAIFDQFPYTSHIESGTVLYKIID